LSVLRQLIIQLEKTVSKHLLLIMAGPATGFIFSDYASNASVVLPYAVIFICMPLIGYIMLVIMTVNGAVVRPYVRGFDWEIIRLFLLAGRHSNRAELLWPCRGAAGCIQHDDAAVLGRGYVQNNEQIKVIAEFFLFP
jgi:hypothetical protein